VSAYLPPTFVDACSYLVRRLVQAAYNMPDNSVRPADQGYPTGNAVTEFATVKIISGPAGDFGTSSVGYEDDPSTGSTKVFENIENTYAFTASIQFFRHALPKDGANLPTFGLSAVDKAARLDSRLSSSSMMELMERMGLGLEDSGAPVDVGAIVGGATWEDRGGVSMTFTIVNREQFLLESFGSASATVQVGQPGRSQPDVFPLEVTT
jgi:hypothetical protein